MTHQQALSDPSVLRKIKRYSGLNADDAAGIADIASIREVPANTDLFTAGEPADRLYILLDGRVSLSIPVPGRSHSESVVTTISKGELLGWSALLPDHVWQTSARTLKACRLIQIPGPELRDVCEQNTDIGYHITKLALNAVGQRLTESRHQILDIFGQADA